MDDEKITELRLVRTVDPVGGRWRVVPDQEIVLHPCLELVVMGDRLEEWASRFDHA
jgi:hypothetical protein